MGRGGGGAGSPWPPLASMTLSNAKNLEIAVPFKCSSNFVELLEINCEINLLLRWSENYLIVNSAWAAIAITEIKLFIPVITL